MCLLHDLDLVLILLTINKFGIFWNLYKIVDSYTKNKENLSINGAFFTLIIINSCNTYTVWSNGLIEILMNPIMQFNKCLPFVKIEQLTLGKGIMLYLRRVNSFASTSILSNAKAVFVSKLSSESSFFIMGRINILAFYGNLTLSMNP